MISWLFSVTRRWLVLPGLALAPLLLHAQMGDHGIEGATQKLPADFPVPSADPVLPEKALGTFELKPGFKLELIAAEPLVDTPVDLAWDADGRLWVVEMSAYMPNVQGEGEKLPTGRIVVLEDTDGDSIMDKRTVFLNELVLPRSIVPVKGGILAGVPPDLLYCRDTDGDLKCDETTRVTGFGDPQGNPEYQPNSLRQAPDNWIYAGMYGSKVRFRDGQWEVAPAESLGQYGLSFDDWGRKYYNGNSHVIATGGEMLGSNKVWPIRVTPGVNRGYEDLGKRDRIDTVTAACGPSVYRGGLLEPEAPENIFVCEPAGNLVKRVLVEEVNGHIETRFAYEGSEFLASTDERFRPVNTLTGPDGGLYIADMYHGFLQHRTFMTTWLRQQILDRGLDKPTGMGRIYRILPEGATPWPQPHLSRKSPAELVPLLSHANGWWRDTAQRLLVESGDRSIVPTLEELALHGGTPQGRFHALWTLEGFQAETELLLIKATRDAHPKVRETALQIALDRKPSDAIFARAREMLADADPAVKAGVLKLLLTHPGAPAREILRQYLSADLSPEEMDELLTLIRRSELTILKWLAQPDQWTVPSDGRRYFFSRLAAGVANKANGAENEELLNLLMQWNPEGWKRLAILKGLTTADRAEGRGRRVRLRREPALLGQLRTLPDAAPTVKALEAIYQWRQPAKVGGRSPETRVPTEADREVLAAGMKTYAMICAACHQPTGAGQPGLAPPLRNSEWIDPDYQNLAAIALHGIEGPLTVDGTEWNLSMPPMGAGLPDDQLAALLSYIQHAFGDETAPLLSSQELRKIKDANKDRSKPWTAAELSKESEAATPAP